MKHQTIISARDYYAIFPSKKVWIDGALGKIPFCKSFRECVTLVSSSILSGVLVRKKLEAVFFRNIDSMIIFYVISNRCFQTCISVGLCLQKDQCIMKMSATLTICLAENKHNSHGRQFCNRGMSVLVIKPKYLLSTTNIESSFVFY